MDKSIYSEKELYSMGPQRTFRGDAGEAAFLLGGIGTGNVSLGARGELRDWEIFNRPGKGDLINYTFFAVYAREEGKNPVAKVLESRLHPPFSKDQGFPSESAAGLPRFKDSRMKGEYPFVWIDFEDDEIPLQVSLEAFTPFIPLNPEDSGIPGAILTYKAVNTGRKPVDVTIAGTIHNAVGICGADTFGWVDGHNFDGNINEFRQEHGVSGFYLYHREYKEDYIRYGSMGLMTPEQNVTCKQYWLTGHNNWDGVHDFWDDFCADGLLEPISGSAPKDGAIVNLRGKQKYSSLGIPACLMPGEEKEFVFVLSWYFPNRIKSWLPSDSRYNHETPIIRNYYSKLFKDAWDAGRYILANYKRLEEMSRKFHKALFGSTLPAYVLDAAASNITVLRSPTCIWLEDGTLIAWEGCHDKEGSCFGTCTHVWNYAQTLAWLFPSLERTMRNVEFNLETDEDGNMAFRTNRILGLPGYDFHPAADGQLGTIVRLYREWKLSGDNDFLEKMWAGAKRALDFAFDYWDSDCDCVLNNQQHNTYDIEFYGPNSLVNSMFFAALKAGAELSQAMGEHERAEKYRQALEKGSKKMDELLWNGEYYIQKIGDVDEFKYQYGTGCLSDQVFGQLLAHLTGLGYVLPGEHVKKAVESIFKYNFLEDFNHHSNVQRTYVLNDEKGLVLCSWPHGGRPRFPFIYSDEVWTGIEYQVAAHLIYEGFIDEGLTIVKAIRERHDGYRRNPWNEVECGHHYARSMASWAVFIALSGFQCDMVKKELRFSPQINKENFQTFWSTGTAWGIYRQKPDDDTGKPVYDIEVLYGSIDGVSV